MFKSALSRTQASSHYSRCARRDGKHPVDAIAASKSIYAAMSGHYLAAQPKALREDNQ